MGKRIIKVSDPVSGYWHDISIYKKGRKKDRPFALIQQSHGKGKFEVTSNVHDPKYLDVNFSGIDSPFKLVKSHFIEAIEEWKDKGWLTEEDFKSMGLERMKTEVDGLGSFPTFEREHKVRRSVESTKENFEL